MQRALFVLAFLVVACVPAPGEPPLNSPSSGSGRTVHPPSPTSDDVDAYGNATDPKIASCMTNASTRQNIFGVGSAVKPNQSNEYKRCWCRAKGYKGLRGDGSCLG